MEFVTKKEYEAALATIEKALKNKQLQIINSSSDRKVIVDTLCFIDSFKDNYPSNMTTFIPGSQAAKEMLHLLRKDIRCLKEHNAEEIKRIEELEKQEQKVVNQLPLLKE